MASKYIQGVDSVVASLKKAQKKGEGVEVQVGYTQNYALVVHERLDVAHKVGQAKYLEQPLRENKDQIQAVIVKAVKAGVSLLQGVLMGGLLLQRMSQKLVPVDTSALKNSAYTSSKKTAFNVANKAFVKSSKIKAAAKKGK